MWGTKKWTKKNSRRFPCWFRSLSLRSEFEKTLTRRRAREVVVLDLSGRGSFFPINRLTQMIIFGRFFISKTPSRYSDTISNRVSLKSQLPPVTTERSILNCLQIGAHTHIHDHCTYVPPHTPTGTHRHTNTHPRFLFAKSPDTCFLTLVPIRFVAIDVFFTMKVFFKQKFRTNFFYIPTTLLCKFAKSTDARRPHRSEQTNEHSESVNDRA